ncbi:uncharacterized protein LOC125672286 [Ostrea edulis]|uniref:uncharacterized protein LOC125672286 n=1 Tax=Ostrea edulis TaxID=37623 RepID=UPI0024AEF510|nr:uncharacterized protein LOC125672286 [Ostrea edulis]
MVKIKKEGMGEVKHKEVISKQDLERLYDSDSGVFSCESPKTLQQKVFFEIMLYFCNRSRENLRNMLRNDYVIRQDPDGRRFLASSVSRLTKNHRGENTTDDDQEGGRMYEQPGNPKCPVMSFEKYLSKLNPDCDALWQRPRSSISACSHVWYDNMVVGKNTLGSMMQRISKDAGLSFIYSNHCIRATCITMLDESGYESRHIIGISKHRSETSLKHYDTKLSDAKKRDMSDALAGKFTSSFKIPESASGKQGEAITNVQRQVMRQIQNDSPSVVVHSNTVGVQEASDVVDVDDLELAAILDNPDLFGTVQNIAQPNSAVKSVFSFHGCNVTINSC